MAHPRGAIRAYPILINDDDAGSMACGATALLLKNFDSGPDDDLVDECTTPDRSMNNGRAAAPYPRLRALSIASNDSDDTLVGDGPFPVDNDEGDTGPLPATVKRNPEVERFMNQVDTYDPSVHNLRHNVTVELESGDFLRIVRILQSTKSGEVFLRGHLFRRTKKLEGMFNHKRNEVFWIQELDVNDSRTPEVQSMVTFRIKSFIRRRELRFTNQDYPASSFRNDKGWVVPAKHDVFKQRKIKRIEDHAPLVCRMKFVSYFENGLDRVQGNCCENAVLFLRQNECETSPESKVSDLLLRAIWRGETKPGGDQVGWKSGEKEFLRQESLSHAGKECHNSLNISGRRYEARSVMERGTVGDIIIPNDDETGTHYIKVSAVGESAFVSSGFNAITGQEFQDVDEDIEEVRRRLEDTLHGSHSTHGVFHINGRNKRQDPRPSSRTTREVIAIGVQPVPQSRKRTALDSFGIEEDSGGMRARGQRREDHRYTFGDCFCGAGGMSRGAVSTDIRVKWGFDSNALACTTYALNFHTALVYLQDAKDFATSQINQKVDICHMSPPCQFFSPAHTRIGRNDDVNTASFFAVGKLLDKSQCRVATLEQTKGILNQQHRQYFNACVREFAQRGFSVRWRIINCADFGLPQRRTRLFMIASCPGESPPPFPSPTHEHPDLEPELWSKLKPWTTINEALATVPDDWPNHSPEKLPRRHDRHPFPGAGHRVANCIMTGGGENTLHPNGGRTYTHRELATLQGFPLGHKFGEGGIRPQIGNAVPPMIAEKILRGVVQHLKKIDGIEAEGTIRGD